MNYAFVNRPAVNTDVIDAVDYYKKINPKLAEQFLVRIEEAIIYIAEYPKGFQIKYKNVRTLMLKQFPYHIHYIVNEEENEIVILAIIHAYKAPEDYSKR